MRLAMAFLNLALLALPAAAEFFVSPDGDDANPGTAAKPFATLTRARDAVRAELADGEKSDIRVWLKGGTYRLTETLVLAVDEAKAGVVALSIVHPTGDPGVDRRGRVHDLAGLGRRIPPAYRQQLRAGQ